MKKLFAIILTGLLLPVFSVLGAVDYDRSPDGNMVTSPVSFEVSIDAFAETGCSTSTYWGVLLTGTPPGYTEFIGGLVASTTTSTSPSFSPPTGQEIGLVSFACSMDGSTLDSEGNVLEGTDGLTAIFTIYASLFSLPGTAISGVLGFITDLLDAIGPLIWLIIGIPLAFVVIVRIIKIVPTK